MSRASARPRDRGATTPGALFAMVLTFTLFVGMANFLVYQYGKGAVQNAVDQAARAGSRASATPYACQQRGYQALDGLMGGPLGDDVQLACADDGEHVRATATATFHGWIELVPDWTVTVAATTAKETA